MMNIEELKNTCMEMKLKALDMALSTGRYGAHIGGGFSAMEIFAVLYDIANISDMHDAHRDRIILSKGHAVLALYTALWKKGLVSDEDLRSFDKNGTRFHGHAHRNLDKGVEFSGGSLGLGVSYAAGVALACKKKNLKNRVYVILGDGECDEGIVWESVMSMAAYNLDNVTLIVDRNGLQLDGPTKDVLDQYRLEEKFKAFNYDVAVVNGHNIEELWLAFSKRDGRRVVIADTVKAHGISFLEQRKESHQCAITEAQYEQAVKEIRDGCNEI